MIDFTTAKPRDIIFKRDATWYCYLKTGEVMEFHNQQLALDFAEKHIQSCIQKSQQAMERRYLKHREKELT